MNKKTLPMAVIVFVSIMLAGCASSGEVKKTVEQPIKDAADYVPEMVNIKEKAQEDVNSAVDQENERLNNTLNEKDMQNENVLKKYPAAVLRTSLGDIRVKFYSSDSPRTVENFLMLSGKGFYDGTKFHRVIKGFMIQGGDPTSQDENMKDRWGTGGPGYKFNDELKGTEKYPQGTLAMANSGPNTNGSQFFIVTANPQAPLPPSYTVFGQVISGMDVALKIENVQTGTNDQPVENVILKSVELLEE